MDNSNMERRIARVRKAFSDKRVTSIEFYKDGSGASFYFTDPTGHHGTPCNMAMSFSIQEATRIISGFRLMQHNFINCL